jgi:hypothetical protein
LFAERGVILASTIDTRYCCCVGHRTGGRAERWASPYSRICRRRPQSPRPSAVGGVFIALAPGSGVISIQDLMCISGRARRRA